MLDKARLCLWFNRLNSNLSYFRVRAASINNRRGRQAFVTGNFFASPFTLDIEQVCTNPGSTDVTSARVEGDPCLAPDRLSDEGQSTAE
jgi:hypothetical protein